MGPYSSFPMYNRMNPTIQAKMEVARAKSLSDIAKIVSFVKIAEALELQGKNKSSLETDDKKASYPKRFLRFYVK